MVTVKDEVDIWRIFLKSKDKPLTKEEILFCRHYAETGNGARAVRQAYGADYKRSYLYGRKVSRLLKRHEIIQQIEIFRQEFLNRYGAAIGDEIIDRARAADDHDAIKYYKLALRMCGLE